MQNNTSYYAIIPANVRYDKDLPPNAKLMYGEITALTNQKGYCWATNDYFSDLYGVRVETISRWINKLRNKGYITTSITRTKTGSSRKISLSDPLDKKVKTPPEATRQKSQDPLDKKVNTPLDKKVKHNNTSINIKENNKSSTTTTGATDFDFNLKSEEKEEEVAAAVDVATSELSEEAKVAAIKQAINQPNKMYVNQAKMECQKKGFDFDEQLNDYAMFIMLDTKFPISTRDESELQKRFWSSCRKMQKVIRPTFAKETNRESLPIHKRKFKYLHGTA